MHGGGNTYITIKQREREESFRRKRSKKYRATAAAAKNNPKREPLHGLLCILLGSWRKLKLSPRPGETRRQGPAWVKNETTPNMTLQLLSSNTYTTTSREGKREILRGGKMHSAREEITQLESTFHEALLPGKQALSKVI